MASACVTFIAFCFGALIYYMQKTSRLDQLNFDMNTITAGDFTVEMDIRTAQYNQFLSERDENDKGESIGIEFRGYIKERVEHELTQARKKRKQEEEEKKEEEKNQALQGTGIFSFKKHNEQRRKTMKQRHHLDEEKDEVKIIDIQFAFNNMKLILLLKKRGLAITNLDFD